MVIWALQQYGKNAFLIGSDDVRTRTTHQIVKQLLFAHDAELVAQSYVPLGEQSFDQLVSKIATQRPDFVLNMLNGDSNQYFFSAMRKAGLRAEDMPVFSTSISEVELAAMGPELMTGHYAAWNYFQSVQSDENRRFVERFHQRFGPQRVLDDPMEASYIGVKLWLNAVRSQASLNLATIKMHLEKDSLSAPEGIVAVDADTRYLWKQVRIGQARADGQFDVVWESGRAMAPPLLPFFISHDESRAIKERAQ